MLRSNKTVEIKVFLKFYACSIRIREAQKLLLTLPSILIIISLNFEKFSFRINFFKEKINRPFLGNWPSRT